MDSLGIVLFIAFVIWNLWRKPRRLEAGSNPKPTKQVLPNIKEERSIPKELRFSYDYGRCCIWGGGRGIDHILLPISPELIIELDNLCAEFDTSLDWEYPPDPSPWTKEQFVDFFNRAELACDRLQKELGTDYTVHNELKKDREMYMSNRRSYADQTQTESGMYSSRSISPG